MRAVRVADLGHIAHQPLAREPPIFALAEDIESLVAADQHVVEGEDGVGCAAESFGAELSEIVPTVVSLEDVADHGRAAIHEIVEGDHGRGARAGCGDRVERGRSPALTPAGLIDVAHHGGRGAAVALIGPHRVVEGRDISAVYGKSRHVNVAAARLIDIADHQVAAAAAAQIIVERVDRAAKTTGPDELESAVSRKHVADDGVVGAGAENGVVEIA